MQSRIRRRGFTLIELLVVISIVTVLLSLLVPSMSKARESVKQVICRNNLRSIWTGVLQYAFNNKDRVPFVEDVNLIDPNANPFAPEHRTSIGRVLNDYVAAGSWKCPAAIKGYPESSGPEGWTMTYWFRTAGKPSEGVPFTRATKGVGSPLDPIVSNYVTFDGRPLKYVSGRRHTPSNPYAPNRDEIGPWTFSFPIIADLINGSETQGTPKYPHRGPIDRRDDLLASRPIFEKAAGTGSKPARMELHAVSDKEVNIYLTRPALPAQTRILIVRRWNARTRFFRSAIAALPAGPLYGYNDQGGSVGVHVARKRNPNGYVAARSNCIDQGLWITCP